VLFLKDLIFSFFRERFGDIVIGVNYLPMFHERWVRVIVNTRTFFSVLVSGGIVPESLDYLITCAIGALNRAEALALRELYKSSSSSSDFYRKMVDNWHSLRESLQETYTKGTPPEKPFSNSYAWKIWSALSAVNGFR
jgi:hypothetical protein